jgi:peptidase E
MSTQIITLGGGGFLTNSEPGLDSYILNQAKSRSPKIGYIGTASGDDPRAVVRFFSRFTKLDCQPSALNLFGRVPNLDDWVLSQDVIFVGGGNTKSMLGVWASWGLAEILRAALENGTVLSGVSAGAICWYDTGVTDSLDSSLTGLDCLGFIAGSCCPHYSLEAERKPFYEDSILKGDITGGVAIDDGAAVHWIDGEPRRIVIGKQGASAYSVKSKRGSISSNQIELAELVDLARTR